MFGRSIASIIVPLFALEKQKRRLNDRNGSSCARVCSETLFGFRQWLNYSTIGGGSLNIKTRVMFYFVGLSVISSVNIALLAVSGYKILYCFGYDGNIIMYNMIT